MPQRKTSSDVDLNAVVSITIHPPYRAIGLLLGYRKTLELIDIVTLRVNEFLTMALTIKWSDQFFHQESFIIFCGIT